MVMVIGRSELGVDELGQRADGLEELGAELVVVDGDVESLLNGRDELHDAERVELGQRSRTARCRP